MSVNSLKALRVMALAVGLINGTSLAYAQLTTEHDVRETLERDGYQQVRDINFGPEYISARAEKDGKQVYLASDSSGKIREQK
jgi:hypothetical protein